MRIAIGGVMHESNTFASTVTDRGRFEEASLTWGDAILPVWREAHHEMGGFIAGAEREGDELAPTVMAWATPSGPWTTRCWTRLWRRSFKGCGEAARMGCCWRFMARW